MEPKLWRTLVRVVSIVPSVKQSYLQAVVVGWRPTYVVTFPLSALGEELLRSLSDTEFPEMFIAKANLSAESPEDLNLQDFEVAPLPSDDDGLM